MKVKKNININNLQDEENYQLYNVAYYDGKKFCTSSGKDVTIWVDEIKKYMIYLKNIEMILRKRYRMK